MKTKRILAAALATASCGSLAIGVGSIVIHGPAALLTGIVAFIALAIAASIIDPTI